MDARGDGPSRSGDLHFHLLPGVDDGPATMADSLELARAAVADGSATVVATPYVRADFVVIAHPERSADAELDGGAALLRELRLGSLAQVNALSLTGRHGLAAAEWAFRFILSGRVALIASDAHGPTRPPALQVARRALVSGGVGEATARSLTLAAPLHLLACGVRARAGLAA